jgi:hypothetical protein
MKLDKEQVSLAVRALLKHIKATKLSSDLLDEENSTFSCRFRRGVGSSECRYGERPVVTL